MMMTYNAVPTGKAVAAGFHHEVNGDIVSTSWSDLVSYFMEQAERRFGPRDAKWFFSGIVFDERGPQLYYPANRKCHVAIQLGTSAASYPYQAYFQLAHEVAHLLGPSQDQRHTNYLEEGMCTSFQIEMWHAVGMTDTGELGPYQEALDLVRQLSALDSDAIKKLREVHPDLRNLNAAKFAAILPAVSSDLIAQLVRDFPLR